MASYNYPNPQAIFYQQFDAVRRDEVVGVLLAVFLGSFGAHHFYLRRTGLGILYLCLFWTGIPSLLGLVECFLMPGRVREFNAVQAAAIASYLGIAVPLWSYAAGAPSVSSAEAATGLLNACPCCGQASPSGARFCSACGSALQ